MGGITNGHSAPLVRFVAGAQDVQHPSAGARDTSLSPRGGFKFMQLRIVVGEELLVVDVGPPLAS